MVQEAKLLRKIVEEESDVCELDKGRCVCWGEIANLGRVMPKGKCKYGKADDIYERHEGSETLECAVSQPTLLPTSTRFFNQPGVFPSQEPKPVPRALKRYTP